MAPTDGCLSRTTLSTAWKYKRTGSRKTFSTGTEQCKSPLYTNFPDTYGPLYFFKAFVDFFLDHLKVAAVSHGREWLKEQLVGFLRGAAMTATSFSPSELHVCRTGPSVRFSPEIVPWVR